MTSPSIAENTQKARLLLEQMSARTHVAPKRLAEPGPNDEALELIFEAARCAPDHGRIQPWRFILASEGRRKELGEAFATALVRRDPLATPDQIASAYEKALRAPCLLLAVVRNAPTEPNIPLHERLISLGCAIQNMLLMAQTLGIDSGITSGQALDDPSIVQLFRIDETEQAICFLNFGTTMVSKPPRVRPQRSSFFQKV